MSVDGAMSHLRGLAARRLRVYANSLRAEIYGTLEEARVGRGRVYHYRGLRPGESWRTGDVMQAGPYGLYPARKRGRPHVASAPGDAPARDTGRLQESIRVVSLDEQTLTALVGPDPSAYRGRAPYPVYLEFGTRGMAPRPYMRRSLQRFVARVRGGAP